MVGAVGMQKKKKGLIFILLWKDVKKWFSCDCSAIAVLGRAEAVSF